LRTYWHLNCHQSLIAAREWAYALDRFEEQVSKELDDISGEMDALRKRKADLESETARLTAGLASGLYSVTVRGR
jgi:hypothetical protein